MTLDGPITTQPFRLDLSEVEEFCRIVQPRRGHWILVVVGTFALPAPIVLIADPSSWLLSVMLLGVAAAFFLAWRAMQPRVRAKALLRKARGTDFDEEHVYAFDDLGISYRSDLAEGLIKWHAILKVEDSPSLILCFIASKFAHIVPKRVVGSDADVEHLLAQIERWRDAAQPYERTCPQCGYALREGKSLGCPECGWRREPARA